MAITRDDLIKESRRNLDRRVRTGNRLLTEAWGQEPQGPDDRHAAASDAISDIITTIVGMAGHYAYEGKPMDETRPTGVWDEDARSEAKALLSSAHCQSWEGDREDYVTE